MSEAHESVWDILSSTEIEEHVREYGGKRKIVYLPWSKAWMLTKRAFPRATYSHGTTISHPDGTVEVCVHVVFNDEFNTVTSATLPVMDNVFGAIKNPNARDLNDARQRCLVKALAFEGLGLSLWSDSIIPLGKLVEPINAQSVDKIKELIEATETNEELFLQWCGVETVEEIPLERYGSALGLLEAKKRKAVSNV